MDPHFYMGTAETYENVFRNKEPIPNANDRYKMILEENARAQMALFSPTHNESAQRIGRLYGAGMNHPLIEDGLQRAALTENGLKGSPVASALTAAAMSPDPHRGLKERGGLHASTISLQHSMTSKHQYPSNSHSPHRFNVYPSHDSSGGAGVGTSDSRFVQPLKTATALGMIDRQAGGKYHVPSHLHEPYATPLMGKPQGSLFTKSTPLMWDLHKAKEAKNSACTKSRLFQQSVSVGGGSRDHLATSTSQLPSSFNPRDIGSPNYNQHTMQSSHDYNRTGDNDHESLQQPSLQSVGRNTSSMELSALQQTLVDCGKLQRAEGRHTEKVSKEVYKSLQADIKHTKDHARWLKHKNQPQHRHQQRQQLQYDDFEVSDVAGSFFSREDVDAESSCDMQRLPKEKSHAQKTIREREKAAMKTLRQRASSVANSSSSSDLSKYKNKIPSRTQGFRGNSSVMKTKATDQEYRKESSSSQFKSKLNRYDRPPPVTDYNNDMAAHLDVTLVSNSNNPHRAQFRDDSHVKFASHQSLQVLKKKGIDPKLYTRNSMNTQYGTYNVTVKEPTIRELPSKEYLSKAMSQISKQMLITYNTKIIETGAALRALQSTKHEKPGIAAILELNSAMIAAAAFNPSLWEVSRHQFEHVMAEQVPWLEKTVVTRLASAYDPQRSGVIKFARMTAALMAGNRPAMSILMTNISRDPDKVDNSGNVFLLRLLHSLYEDVDGGVVEEIASTLERDPSKCMKIVKPNTNTGLGIKLEDVPEILSVCATNVEDETVMKNMAMEVVQVLYECGKAQDENFENIDERYRNLRSTRPSSTAMEDSQKESQEMESQKESQVGSQEGIDSQVASQLESQVGDEESLNSCSFASTTSTLSKSVREKDENYDDVEKKDRLFASKVLKFDMLKSISAISRVSQTAFIKCVARHPTIMKEFGRQVDRFRELITPYQVKGSISYEDSLSQNSTYGIAH